MGHLLLTHATGPFNREFVAAWSSLAAQTHPAMAARGSWTELVVFHISAMASIDTLAEFTRRMIDLRSAGLQPVATAFCLPPEVEGASFMAPLFTRCFQDAALSFRVYTEVESAKHWLACQVECTAVTGRS